MILVYMLQMYLILTMLIVYKCIQVCENVIFLKIFGIF